MDDFYEQLEKLKLLTTREIEFLELRCEGKSYDEISKELVVTVSTVKSHFQHIYQKLELDDYGTARRNIELHKYRSALEAVKNTTQRAIPKINIPEPEAWSKDDSVQAVIEEKSLVAVLEDEIYLLENRSRDIQSLSATPISSSRSYGPSTRTQRTIFFTVLLGLVAIIGGFIGASIMLIVIMRVGGPLVRSTDSFGSTPGTQLDSPPAVYSTSTTASTPLSMIMPTASITVSTTTVCGEVNRAIVPIPPLLRPQGVTAYTPGNTNEAVLSNKVRALTIDERGIWAGYFLTDQSPINGVGQYNRTSWANCNLPGEGAGKNANALVIDQLNRVWVGTEEGGVSVWDGKIWKNYTVHDGLPSNKVYGLTIDKQDNIWVATWEGVSKFDGQDWTVPYSVHTHTIFSNHVHAIAFDSEGNIWIGHIDKGVSQYRKSDGQWVYYNTDIPNGIGGDLVRSILVRPAANGLPESIWFATADGGVSKFEQGNWIVYRVKDGLPSDTVIAVAMDKYNRIWATTAKGVAYFDNIKWTIYDTLSTESIAFGPDCENCPYNDDHVWTGTTDNGLTHSRLPYPEEAIDVVSIRFYKYDGTEITSPGIVSPGEKFRPEITVRPRSPYQLRESRGDFLAHIDADDSLRFGAYVQMAVKGTVESGEPFAFTDFDNFFVAPQLAPGETEKTFISSWRVWMFTRYVGPIIRIIFTVRAP